MSTIKSDSIVTMHFTIYLADGSVADSTKVNAKPGIVTLGDGTLSGAFEAELLGMKIGEQKRFTLSAVDSFGESNPEQIHEMSIEQFEDIKKLEPGVIIEFTNMAGQIHPGVVRSVTDKHVMVDFNHLLAGKECTFEVEILDISQ